MSEESAMGYKDGDIVWVKLGPSWWPGEVIDADKLDKEILDFKKQPLVVVKFFEEDTYEFVKKWNDIFPYNCEKKNDFIKKGMAAFRAKTPHMEKFPKDVSNAEVLTGGNPNILSQPIFLPEKRTNYDEIFGMASPKGKSKDKKSRPSKIHEDFSYITHRRFLGYDDYKAFVCIQFPGKDRIPGDEEDEEVVNINREPSEEYNCHSCSFTTTRLEIMIFHTKSHIQGIYVPSSPKKRPAVVRLKKEKVKKARTKTDSSDEDYMEVPKEKKRKVRSKVPKVLEIESEVQETPASSTDIRSNLLAEWEDSDDDLEETVEKVQDTSVVTESSTSIVEEIEINDTLNTTNAEEIEETEKPEKSRVETEDDKREESKNEEIGQKENVPAEVTSEKDAQPEKSEDLKKMEIQQAIKSCFDFDEDDEETIIPTATTGRKIPRVIPITERKKSKEIEEDEDEAVNKEEILKTSESFNQKNQDKDKSEIEDAFKELMEITAVPQLPDVQNSLKCEQNFHSTRTIKFPDKQEFAGSTAPNIDKTEESATKLTNPKKRFVKSFEEFENEIRRKEKLEEEEKEGRKELIEEEEEDGVEELKIPEIAKLKCKIMSKIIEEAKVSEDKKEKILLKIVKSPKHRKLQEQIEEEAKSFSFNSTKRRTSPKKLRDSSKKSPQGSSQKEESNLELSIEPIKIKLGDIILKSSSKDRKPRSKLMESWILNDKKEEEVPEESTLTTSLLQVALESKKEDVVEAEPQNEPNDVEKMKREIVPPKKNKWSRRLSHPKKIRHLFDFQADTETVTNSQAVEDTETVSELPKPEESVADVEKSNDVSEDLAKQNDVDNDQESEVVDSETRRIEDGLTVQIDPSDNTLESSSINAFSLSSKDELSPIEKATVFLPEDAICSPPQKSKKRKSRSSTEDEQSLTDFYLFEKRRKASEDTEKEKSFEEVFEVSGVAEQVPEVPEQVPKVSKISEVSELVSEDSVKVSEDSEKVSEDSEKVSEDSEKVSEDSEKVSDDSEKVSEDSEKVFEDSEKVSEDSEKVSEDLEKVSEDPEIFVVSEKVSEVSEVSDKEETVLKVLEDDSERVKLDTSATQEKLDEVEDDSKKESQLKVETVQHEMKPVGANVSESTEESETTIVTENEEEKIVKTAQEVPPQKGGDHEKLITEEIIEEVVSFNDNLLQVDEETVIADCNNLNPETTEDVIEEVAIIQREEAIETKEIDLGEKLLEDSCKIDEKVADLLIESDRIKETVDLPILADRIEETVVGNEKIEETVINTIEEVEDLTKLDALKQEDKIDTNTENVEEKVEKSSDLLPEVKIEEVAKIPEKPIKKSSKKKSSKKKPTKKKPIEKKLIEEKPVEVKPIEEKPVEEKPIEEKLSEETLPEDKPTIEKPSEEKATEELAEHHNEVEVELADNSLDGFKFSIQTNLSNFSSREEISAIALATLAEMKTDVENSDSNASADLTEIKIPPPPYPEPELVSIEGNLTVVSEKDLADGQMEITTEKQTILTNLSSDFPKSKSFDPRGTEFTSKAMTKEFKHPVGNKQGKTYEKYELINILEGTDSDKQHTLPKKSIVDDFCDFEDHIPSQIVCAKKLKMDKERELKDEALKKQEMKFEKRSRVSKSSVTSTTSKLLERLSESKTTPKSEYVPKPRTSRSKSGSKVADIKPKPLGDFEDVAAFVICKDVKKTKDDLQKSENIDTKAGKSNKSTGKAKILQQTIIRPAGETAPPKSTPHQSDMFDINSMPIVLSDEILTPETLENMPIVLGNSPNITIPSTLDCLFFPDRKSTKTIITKAGASKVVIPLKPPTLVPKVSPRILQTVSNKIKPPTTLITGIAGVPTVAKPGKYIIVPQSTPMPITSKAITKKIPLKKTTVTPGIVTTAAEATGNKIMILTNQQGQQQRLLLTPAQQKLLGYPAGSKIAKTIVKNTTKTVIPTTVPETSLAVKPPGLVTQKIVGSIVPITTPELATTSPAIKTTKGITVHKRTVTTTKPLSSPKASKTIFLKSQTVKKVQSTEEDLEKQVKEQLEAIRASSAMQFGHTKVPEVKPIPKTMSRRSYGKKVETKSKTVAVPAETVKTESPVKKIESSPVPKPETKPERPLNQLVIQDAVGNQTTITEGQILALPSETVDGQPQSYMLVTLDESGNLTPLNNEALMSLDPNLTGDLSNMVLQIEPNAMQQLAQPATVKTSKIEPPVEMPVSKPEIVPEPPIVRSVNGEPGQQLIISGDPVATQKFLESLSEGTTDLANILANAEGNSILIQADGQQILINTNSENLLVNNSANEGGGNPVFATQPSKSQDILAAALADTDVFQPDQPIQSKLTSQLSPNNTLYPMNVGNVLETSLTLSSPIMTPLEVPSTNNKKIPDDEADILTQIPKNVDLPITITDPNISQTVANQQVVSLLPPDLPTNLELTIPMDTSSKEMTSPYNHYSLPTLDETVDMSQKTFSSSMPLLNEDVIDESVQLNNKSLIEEEPSIEVECRTMEEGPEKSCMNARGSFLDEEEEEEGRFTLGGEICSSLSEPPPEMFDLPEVNQSFMKNNISSLQSTPEPSSKDEDTDLSTLAESSNDSCEIPVQPKIIAKSQNLEAFGSD